MASHEPLLFGKGYTTEDGQLFIGFRSMDMSSNSVMMHAGDKVLAIIAPGRAAPGGGPIRNVRAMYKGSPDHDPSVAAQTGADEQFLMNNQLVMYHFK